MKDDNSELMEKYRKDSERYQKIKKMNFAQFKEIVRSCREGEFTRLDDALDAYGKSL